MTPKPASSRRRPPKPDPLAVAVSADGMRVPVAVSRVAELARRVLRAQGVRQAMLSVTFVGSRAMASLNRRHLGHRGPTDVITFALGTSPVGAVIGDVYICPEVARAQAAEHGVGIREELARLVVHGLLHTCGLDHPEDEGRMTSPMWRRQEQLLRRFWITPSRRT